MDEILGRGKAKKSKSTKKAPKKLRSTKVKKTKTLKVKKPKKSIGVKKAKIHVTKKGKKHGKVSHKKGGAGMDQYFDADGGLNPTLYTLDATKQIQALDMVNSNTGQVPDYNAFGLEPSQNQFAYGAPPGVESEMMANTLFGGKKKSKSKSSKSKKSTKSKSSKSSKSGKGDKMVGSLKDLKKDSSGNYWLNVGKEPRIYRKNRGTYDEIHVLRERIEKDKMGLITGNLLYKPFPNPMMGLNLPGVMGRSDKYSFNSPITTTLNQPSVPNTGLKKV